MKPKIWWQPDDYPESLVGDYDETCGPARQVFLEGKAVRVRQAPRLLFACPKKRLMKWDVIHNISGLPICNERTRSLVRARLGEQVQEVAVRVETRDGVLSGYAILNLLARVQLVDRGRSDVVFIRGTQEILKFRRLAFLDLPPGVHMARTSEYPPYVLVSAELASLLLESKVTGFAVVDDHDICP
jgi:hypothetical protein